jgi:hypothetical protein
MKLQTEKVIAREFLMLILVFGLGIMGFLCTYPYNRFQYSKLNDLKIAIDKKSEELEKLNENLSKALILIEHPKDSLINSSDTPINAFVDTSVSNHFCLIPPLPKGFTPQDINLYRSMYIEGIYDLIKNNIEGFTKTPDDFKRLMLDTSSYSERVYKALKEAVNNKIQKKEYYDALSNNNLENKINKWVSIDDEFSKIRIQQKQIESSVLSFREQMKIGGILIFFFLIILFGFRYLIYGIRWSFKTLKTK